MTAEERRLAILEQLRNTTSPLSASLLAGEYSVSRQIIVGDVALLRAGGASIIATPRGYLLQSAPSKHHAQIACCHDSDDMKKELYALVDEGCTVVDVIVEHPLYGQLTGLLGVSNRHEVDEFIKRCEEADALPLSVLTEGIHLHTIETNDPDNIKRAVMKLERLGFILSK
ncbi:MAG: transcription repressor NadR [Lachnospiraceae bacterium]|nr:transcription repressor NadR [Candidatus Equihabitans merdae]